MVTILLLTILLLNVIRWLYDVSPYLGFVDFFFSGHKKYIFSSGLSIIVRSMSSKERFFFVVVF